MKKIMVWMLGLAMVLGMFGACAEGEALTFEALSALEWEFSSGAGGWSTELHIEADGAFTGSYHDSEMGETGEGYPNGSLYLCGFSGQLSIVEQLDVNTWKLRVDSLSLDDEPGQETIEDEIRYVTTEPYGISEGDEMTLYLPGTPVDALNEDMRMWAHLLGDELPEAMESWLLYSKKNESGFVGYAFEEGEEIANPWQDMTAEELAQTAGVEFGLPEGAGDVIYRWLADESLAEMQFTLDGDEYTARIKPDALQAGELDNISDIYIPWEHEEQLTIGHCDGMIALAQTGSEDWTELCLWYDMAPGLMYSLSVYTTDPDGLDLTAVAEMVYAPMQGDA